MDSLAYLLENKRINFDETERVVKAASSWMESQFREARIPFHFAEGGFQHDAYGYFQIKARYLDTPVTLHIKVAEINEQPYCFADIRIRGQTERVLFPFFGEIGSDHGRLTILHYIADFLLSTKIDVAAN